MASQDQLVKIANNFLLNAPPGELMEVVTDVRALLPDAHMLDSTAPTTFKKYNEDQMVQVEREGHHFLVTSYGEVGTNEYIDHVGNAVVTFDHVKQEIVSTRPLEDSDKDGNLEGLRAELDTAVAGYVKDHYPFGTHGVYTKGGDIYICITSTRFNPNNYWNGRWRSVWKVPGKGGNIY